MRSANYGEEVGAIARAESAAGFRSSQWRLGEMAITKLVRSIPCGDVTEPLGGDEDAFVASVSLQPRYARDSWINGKPLADVGPMVQGTTNLMDMRDRNQARFRSAVRMIQFYFSRRAINMCADEQGVTRVAELQAKPLTPLVDTTFHQLALVMRPAFVKPSEVSRLFLDSVMLAGCAHFIQAYGGVAMETLRRGGLAPWQLKRSMEMLDAALDGDVSLTAVAAECRLSPRHFSRAFTQSTGMPPHRWLLRRRIDKAQDLLRNPALPLRDIAKAGGFASQSHFNRAFVAIVGLTPGAWRRAHL